MLFLFPTRPGIDGVGLQDYLALADVYGGAADGKYLISIHKCRPRRGSACDGCRKGYGAEVFSREACDGARRVWTCLEPI